MEIKEYIEQLRANDYIREKDLGNGISSFNFTNKAFYKQAWSDQVNKARGLFIDVVNNRIVARSFDKFFATYEDNCKPVEEFVYPVTLYKKENGFLGIMSGLDEKTPFLASKSTNCGDFKDIFEEILTKEIGQSMVNAAANYLYRNNLTAVFEVIDPVRDPHIVEYDKSTVYLLALVENEIEFKQRPYFELKWFADLLQVKYKGIMHRVYSVEVLNEFLTENESKEELEGFVLEDANGYMAKYKTFWYRDWKRIRGQLAAFRSDSSKPAPFSDLFGETEARMLTMIFLDKCPNGSVIDFRNFLKDELRL